MSEKEALLPTKRIFKTNVPSKLFLINFRASNNLQVLLIQS